MPKFCYVVISSMFCHQVALLLLDYKKKSTTLIFIRPQSVFHQKNKKRRTLFLKDDIIFFDDWFFLFFQPDIFFARDTHCSAPEIGAQRAQKWCDYLTFGQKLVKVEHRKNIKIETAKKKVHNSWFDFLNPR